MPTPSPVILTSYTDYSLAVFRQTAWSFLKRRAGLSAIDGNFWRQRCHSTLWETKGRLSNGTCFDDLDWPLTRTSRSTLTNTVITQFS